MKVRQLIAKKDWLILASICSAVFLFRFAILSKSQITLFSDDAIYASLARFWVEGEWAYVFHPTWQPLFPFLSAVVYLVVQEWEVALRLVSLFSGVALLIPLFLLVRKTISLTHASLFILILGFFYPLLFSSLLPLSDSLSATLIASFFVAIFFGLESGKTRLFYLGAFLIGLAYLTRSEGLLFFSLTTLFLTGYFLVHVLFKGKSAKILLCTPMFIFIFLVTVSPYAVAIKNKLGTWTLSQKFSAQIRQGHSFEFREDGTVWAQEIYSVKEPNYRSRYFHDGIVYLSDNFDYFWSWFGQKILWWKGIFVQIFPVWSVFLMVLGVLCLLKRYFWGIMFFLFILLIAVPVTVFSVPIADVRYLLWTVPLFLYFFYKGFDFTIMLFWKKLPITFVVTPFFIIFFFPAISWVTTLGPNTLTLEFTHRYYKPYILEIANWITKDSDREHPRVATRYEALEFYTRGTTLYIPQISYDGFVEYAKRYSADYIIAWSAEIAADKNLSILLDRSVSKPGLKEVYALDTPDGKIIVYRLAN